MENCSKLLLIYLIRKKRREDIENYLRKNLRKSKRK